MAKQQASNEKLTAFKSKLTGSTMYLTDDQIKGANVRGHIDNLEQIGDATNLENVSNEPPKVSGGLVKPSQD